MAMVTDTITIVTTVPTEKWLWDQFCFERSEIGGYQVVTVSGVQWKSKIERVNENGVVKFIKYASITLPEGVYENFIFDMLDESMAVFLGTLDEDLRDEKGYRVSDYLKKYQKSGLIRSISDNSNRDYLKHVKVVVS